MAGDNPELRIVIEDEGEGGQPKPGAAPSSATGGESSDLAASIQRDLEQFKQYQQRLISEQSRYSTYKQAVRSGGMRDPAYEASAKDTISSIKGGMEAIGEVFKSIETLSRTAIPEAGAAAAGLQQFRALQQQSVQPSAVPPPPNGMYQRGSPQRQAKALRLVRGRRRQRRVSGRQAQAKAQKQAQRNAGLQAMWNRRFAANRMRAGATVLQSAGAFMGRGGRVAQIASLGLRGAASIAARGGLGAAAGGAGGIGAGAAGGAAEAGAAGGGLALAAGPVGIAIAGVGASLAALTGATYALVSSINDQTERYGPLSSDYLQTRQRLNLAGFEADVRRAQRIGPELSDFAEQRFALSQSWEDVKANLTKDLEPLLSSGIAGLKDITDRIGYFLNPSVDVGSKLKMFGINFAQGAVEAVGFQEATGTLTGFLEPLRHWLYLQTQKLEDELTVFPGVKNVDAANWNTLFNMHIPGTPNPIRRGVPQPQRNIQFPRPRRNAGGPMNII